MASAPDTLVLTGPVLQQTAADLLLVTPTGGAQTTLAAALAAGGSGGGPVNATTLTATGNVTLSGSNAAVAISPTGTGTVVINPATAGTIDNEVIGGATPLAGTFTTLSAASLIATGNVTAAFLAEGVSNNIASTGSTSATALALTKAINVLGTAVTGTGVVLPAIGNGASQTPVGGSAYLFNGGAGPVTVYGAGANTIDTVAGTTGVKLSNALRCRYFAMTASTYVSAQLGAVSA